MIRYLGIERLAVIDSLEVEFRPGLNVLTGETGAGKSIVVGAIALLTGARAYPELVRTGEDSALVQAVFETPDGSEVSIRRDVLRKGRSRAFVDGALTSNARLQEITGRLVDLLGQHDQQRLLDPRFQLGLLDAFGDLQEQRRTTRDAFASWQGARQEHERLETAARSTADRREALQFTLAEIDAVEPRPGEDVELQATQRRLANTGRLQQLCTEVYQRLYESDDAIVNQLGFVWSALGELAELDPSFKAQAAAREEIDSTIEDMAFTLRSYASDLEFAPSTLEEIEARLAALEHLKKKHGGDLESVLDRRSLIRSELEQIEQSSERLGEAARTVAERRRCYVDASQALSRARRSTAPELERQLRRVLAELAMAEARCEFRLEASGSEERWLPDGIDVGELLLSANRGEAVKPLAKVASGGELSRIMLGLKTMAMTDEPGRTLVFDEVDAGIGGEVANVVGHRLRELGARCQVLCITHLPQIASAADSQFHVTKAVVGGRTVTRVRRLEGSERSAEIARMIGGERSSQGIAASARELLERGPEGRVNESRGESERAKAKGGRCG